MIVLQRRGHCDDEHVRRLDLERGGQIAARQHAWDERVEVLKFLDMDVTRLDCIDEVLVRIGAEYSAMQSDHCGGKMSDITRPSTATLRRESEALRDDPRDTCRGMTVAERIVRASHCRIGGIIVEER